MTELSMFLGAFKVDSDGLHPVPLHWGERPEPSPEMTDRVKNRAILPNGYCTLCTSSFQCSDAGKCINPP